MKKYNLFAFLPFLIYGSLFALPVQTQLEFKSLTIDEGLSNNRVNALCQDARGFIWIGTQSGVNKYDGYYITQYHHIHEDTTSLVSSNVNTIILDSHNQLWFGMEGGLNIYNPDLDCFRTIHCTETQKSPGDVKAIAEDQNEKLWIGTSTGLYIYDLNEKCLKLYSDSESELPHAYINRLFVDSHNRVWIVVLDEGLCLLNQDDGKIQCFKNNPDDPRSISGNTIETIYEDSKGNIWIGTFDDGFNLYHSETSDFTSYIPDPENNYSTRVRVIFEDPDGNLFLGTRSGLYLMDVDNKSFIHCASSTHNYSRITNSSIMSTIIDRSGCLWLGTFAGGVNYTDLYHKKFMHVKANLRDESFIHNESVFAFNEDLQGNLWVGTDNGLNRLDHKSNTFSTWLHEPDNPNSISYNDVKALSVDEKGNLWIGSNRGGVDYYDMSNHTFIHYHHDKSNPASLTNNRVYGMLYDSNQNLWVLTNENQDINFHSDIHILKKGSHDFIHLKEKGYFGISESRSGNILIGSLGGIWHFHPQDSVFTFIENDSLIGAVLCVYEDTQGTIWIGSKNGLVKYHPETGHFVRLSDVENYPIYIVYGILEDDQNNLWISTSSGLIKLIDAVHDHQRYEYHKYTKDDGIQSAQFNYNAFYKNNQGHMFFGGVDGFNKFDPAEIRDNPYKPQVVITKLDLFNREVSVGQKVNNNVILPKAITQMDELVFSYKEKVITFHFAALHYANTNKNQFTYILEGFDTEWSAASTRHSATYTSIDPGEYIFRVNGSNNDGLFSDQEVSLRIVVTPSFYQTLYFKFIGVISLILILIGIYRLRMGKMIEHTHDLESLNEQLSKHIHEREQAEKRVQKQLEEKNVLLKEIHHRVKNNLQIIVSLLRLQSNKVDNKETQKILLDSRERVLSMALVHEKLYHTDNLAEIDFSEYIPNLLKELVKAYQVELQKIDIDLQCEKISLAIDHAVPCALLLNELISNILKHAFPKEWDKPRNISIALSKDNDNVIHLVVADNGKGLPPDFDPVTSESLGLKLIYILVEDQLDGEVEILQEDGTTFHIQLFNKSP